MFHLSCVDFFLDSRVPESQDPYDPEWLVSFMEKLDGF